MAEQPERPDAPTTMTMEDVLHAMGKGVFPEGAMCTGWVIVSEWMDVEGEYWTYVGADDRNPPWRHYGLMSWVMDNGAIGPQEVNGDDDDDDDDE